MTNDIPRLRTAYGNAEQCLTSDCSDSTKMGAALSTVRAVSSWAGLKFGHFYTPFLGCLEAAPTVAVFSALLQVKD